MNKANDCGLYKLVKHVKTALKPAMEKGEVCELCNDDNVLLQRLTYTTLATYHRKTFP